MNILPDELMRMMWLAKAEVQESLVQALRTMALHTESEEAAAALNEASVLFERKYIAQPDTEATTES